MPPPRAIIDVLLTMVMEHAKVGDVPLTRLAIDADALDEKRMRSGGRMPGAALNARPPLLP